MLKAYAVAMVLATTPVAAKTEESVQAPAKSKAAATKTVATTKNGRRAGTIRFGRRAGTIRF